MLDFGIKDVIDILCVAVLLYQIYRLMKSSGSLNIFYGILVFILVWIVVSQMFEMKLLGSIFAAEGAKTDEARQEGDDLMTG